MPIRQPPTALILVPDVSLREELTAAAETHGFATVHWQNPSTVIDYCRRHVPHLLITDWSVHNQESSALCQQLRAADQAPLPVVLALVADPGQLAAAAGSGADFPAVRDQRASFLPWLMIAARRVEELRNQSGESGKALVDTFRQELEATNEQLEAAIMRANQLAMEAELAYIELNQIFRTSPGGILLIDRDFNVMRHNEAFRKMAGVGEQPAAGSKCYQVFGSARCHSPECLLTRILGGEKRIQYEGQRDLAGAEVHYIVSGSPFQAPDGELIGAVLHLTDISDRVRAEHTLKESERRYMELSNVDELTKLYNKRYFNEQLGREIARTWRYNHPLAILMLDIDDFKIHNDTYGHAEGDRVLARIGELLRSNLRTTDVACRYGGEEFVVILPETSGEQAMVVAERIRGSVAGEEFQPVPGKRVGKTVSLGIAQYAPGEEGEELVVRADRNLYRAKQQGKNLAVFA